MSWFLDMQYGSGESNQIKVETATGKHVGTGNLSKKRLVNKSSGSGFDEQMSNDFLGVTEFERYSHFVTRITISRVVRSL